VTAGDQTLRAIAAQDGPLGRAISQLPQTLQLTRTTLSEIVPFARALGPTLAALGPTVARLRSTLLRLSGFSTVADRSIARGLEPFTLAALPLAHALIPTVSRLRSATPDLSGSFQTLEYLVNELAYNPNVGDNQGFLFWIPWFFHNLNSVTSFADANGGIGRAAPLFTCYGLQDVTRLQRLWGVAGLCPS
jgi:ABC-type transporter Mla subunit MlaD